METENAARMVRLSKRMEAVAALVTPGGILADVGTDHAHLPIALVGRGTVSVAIAMDVRPGPLSRARENIARYGLSDRITVRLSDGAEALSPGEADSIVIAGMGGELMNRILSEGEPVCRQAGELILQPQSQIDGVRRFLREGGYRITREDMVCEDGKYYPMLRAESAAVRQDRDACGSEEMYELYGPLLLKERHPVLLSYLKNRRKQLAELSERLSACAPTERIVRRREAVAREISFCEQALGVYGCPKEPCGWRKTRFGSDRR